MQRAASAWSRLSALAASLLVASVVTAVGEPSTIERDELLIEMPASRMTLAALDTPVAGSKQTATDHAVDRRDPNADRRIALSAADTIIGIASFYDEPQKTASGEPYDPNAFTAAAQLEIRGRFGGIRYGRLYQPAYGLGEYGGKKIIVRFNDVGPLRPGRKFDLSRAAMAYFDNSLDKGLLPDFRMTPLPLGRTYPEGPITDQQLADLGIDDDMASAICAVDLEDLTPIHTASIAPVKPRAIKIARPGKSKARSALRARAKAKITIAAPKVPAQTQEAVSPWVRHAIEWVASPVAIEPPAQRGVDRVSDQRRSKKKSRATRKVLAQAR
jgi:rare lipoprotein A